MHAYEGDRPGGAVLAGLKEILERSDGNSRRLRLTDNTPRFPGVESLNRIGDPSGAGWRKCSVFHAYRVLV